MEEGNDKMAQKIEKTCKVESAYRRKQKFYKQARLAFGDVLDFLGMGEGDKILMPAYIGWSAREGSGVFDPVKERKITPIFYHMRRNLSIDVFDCKKKIDTEDAKVLLIIHYFGFVDESAKEIIAYAKEKGMTVIEDAAHALYSDKIGRACGCDGDYTLYSLHKMLPFSEGGVLLSNNDDLPAGITNDFYDYSQFDLSAIAEMRISNYRKIKEMLDSYNNHHVHILKSQLEPGIVPQTFPVILTDTDRDQIYSEMNDRGWGIVSLYHTMIDNLQNRDFADECWLSKHISNLPVHQDVDESLIGEMVNDFVRIVEKYATDK